MAPKTGPLAGPLYGGKANALAGADNDPLPTGGPTSTKENPLGILGPYTPDPNDPSRNIYTPPVMYPNAPQTWTPGISGSDLLNQPKTTPYGTPIKPEPYLENDQWAPLGTPGKIPQLQMYLVNAGLLDPKDVRAGVWGQDEADAYKQAMAMANAAGMYVDDLLIVRGSAGGPAEEKQRLAPKQLTNPADLAKAYRDTAQQLTGQYLPQSENAQFAAQYQAQEQAAYKQLQAAYDNGEMFAGNQPPSATAAAEDYINKHHLSDKIAYGAATRMQDFFGMLRSAGGGLTAAEGQ